MGTGPRELIEKRDGAMGMYNGQLQTEDGMVDITKDQRNDYLNRGNALQDVLAGKIQGSSPEPELRMVEDVEHQTWQPQSLLI